MCNLHLTDDSETYNVRFYPTASSTMETRQFQCIKSGGKNGRNSIIKVSDTKKKKKRPYFLFSRLKLLMTEASFLTSLQI